MRFIKPEELKPGSHITLSNTETRPGEFEAQLELDDAEPVTFTRADALTYAVDLVRAATIATYQANLCRQLVEMGIEVGLVENFIEVVNDVLDEAGVTRAFTTLQFTCRGGVLHHEGRFHPLVLVDRDGLPREHWDVDEAHRLALGFLGSSLSGDLDTIYHAAAMNLMQVDEAVASKLVLNLPVTLPFVWQTN